VTLVLIGKGFVLGGWVSSKIEVIKGFQVHNLSMRAPQNVLHKRQNPPKNEKKSGHTGIQLRVEVDEISNPSQQKKLVEIQSSQASASEKTP